MTVGVKNGAVTLWCGLPEEGTSPVRQIRLAPDQPAVVGRSEGNLLVIGVPRTDGGIRPPRNRTRLHYPEPRPLNPGEEYLIESGATAVIVLPNDSEEQISAE